MVFRSTIFAAAILAAHSVAAQEHRFEADPVVMVRENFVACAVLSQLQRVMDNPRFLLVDQLEAAFATSLRPFGDRTYRTETRLPGWAYRTRTQKCRRKLS
jgi:hypothetical protein